MLNRICIAGAPRTGKTTLANLLAPLLGVDPMHTDNLIGNFEWSEMSLQVSEWLAEPGPWVIEGVALPRALRKWLDRNESGTPADLILYLSAPQQELTPGQMTMAKGCATVWREILPRLGERGVMIVGGPKHIPSACESSAIEAMESLPPAGHGPDIDLAKTLT